MAIDKERKHTPGIFDFAHEECGDAFCFDALNDIPKAKKNTVFNSISPDTFDAKVFIMMYRFPDQRVHFCNEDIFVENDTHPTCSAEEAENRLFYKERL